MKFFLITLIGTLLGSIYSASLRSGDTQQLGKLVGDAELFGGDAVRKIEVRSPVSGVISKINLSGTGYYSPGTAFVITAETSQYYRSTVNTNGKSISVKRVVDGGRNVYVQIFRIFYVVYLTAKKPGDSVSQYDLLALLYVRKTQQGETPSVQKLPRSVPTRPISLPSTLENETIPSEKEETGELKVETPLISEKDQEISEDLKYNKTAEVLEMKHEDQGVVDENVKLSDVVSDNQTSLDVSSIPDKIDDVVKDAEYQLLETADKDSEFLSEFSSDSDDSRSTSTSNKLISNDTNIPEDKIYDDSDDEGNQEVTILLKDERVSTPLDENNSGDTLQTRTSIVSVTRTLDLNKSGNYTQDNKGVDNSKNQSLNERILQGNESRSDDLDDRESTDEELDDDFKDEETSDDLKTRSNLRENEQLIVTGLSEDNLNNSTNNESRSNITENNEYDLVTLSQEQKSVEQKPEQGSELETQSLEQRFDEQKSGLTLLPEGEKFEPAVLSQEHKPDVIGPYEEQKSEEQSQEQKTEEQESEEQKSEEQKSEEQKTEEQKTEEQKTEEQKTEEQKTEEQKTEEQKTEEQKTEEQESEEQESKVMGESQEQKPNEQGFEALVQSHEQKSEEQKSEEQKSVEQKSEEQKTEEQESEEQKSVEQKSEEQKSEEQKSEEQKSEEQKSEEQKSEEQKSEEQKSEEQKSEEQKSEEQKSEEQKSEEQKSEEQKSGEQKSDEQSEHFPGLPDQPLTTTETPLKSELDNLEASSAGLTSSGTSPNEASLFSAGQLITSNMENSGSDQQLSDDG